MELLEFAFTGINIVPTVLLIFTLVYWLIVILGVIDIDSLDVDFETDLDMDVDADVHADIGGFSSVLSFFNIGHMPLMVFVSFFVLPLWTLTLVGNDSLGFTGWLSGGLVFAVVSIFSLFIAKILTTPIAKFYRKVKMNTEAVEDILGKVCTAKLRITSHKKSQAEIKVGGTSVLINAKTQEGYEIAKGQSALVIDFAESENCYYVEPYQL